MELVLYYVFTRSKFASISASGNIISQKRITMYGTNMLILPLHKNNQVNASLIHNMHFQVKVLIVLRHSFLKMIFQFFGFQYHGGSNLDVL